MVGKKYP